MSDWAKKKKKKPTTSVEDACANLRILFMWSSLTSQTGWFLANLISELESVKK
jgi:hypothetical protein